MYRQRYAEHTSRNYDLSMPQTECFVDKADDCLLTEVPAESADHNRQPAEPNTPHQHPKDPKPAENPAEPPNPRSQRPPTREDPAVGSSRPPLTRQLGGGQGRTSPLDTRRRHLTPVTEEGHSRTCSTVVCPARRRPTDRGR